jgi:hypothetical protein
LLTIKCNQEDGLIYKREPTKKDDDSPERVASPIKLLPTDMHKRESKFSLTVVTEPELLRQQTTTAVLVKERNQDVSEIYLKPSEHRQLRTLTDLIKKKFDSMR